MAKKVEAPANQAAVKAAEELDVLHPERSVVLAGRAVTVREYGFVEGTRLRLLAKPFTDQLFAFIKGQEVPHYEAVLDIIAEHIDLVVALMAQAADVEVEWIQQLSSDDGELLTLMWWGANGSFFMRAALQRLRAEREVVALLAGAASTPPSSPMATTSESSAATPNES